MVKGLTKDTVLLPNIPLKTAQKDNSVKPKYKRRFHVMAKPGGAKCNIDCKYHETILIQSIPNYLFHSHFYSIYSKLSIPILFRINLFQIIYSNNTT